MARTPAPRPEVAAHKPYLDGVAKSLADKLLGPDGHLPAGTTFADLEELLVQLGRSITQEALTRVLQRDADAALPAGAGLCPTCATRGIPDDPEPRAVVTRAGDTAWDEPRRHCPRCRRSFFPSIGPIGAGPLGTVAGDPGQGDSRRGHPVVVRHRE